MNKQKRKKRGKKSVQNLLGLQGFTTYGLRTLGGELVYFAIQPTNIFVLSHANIEIKIRHLLMVLTALPHLEVACLDAAQRFDDNQNFMEQRIRQEDNPKVRLARGRGVCHAPVGAAHIFPSKFLTGVDLGGQLLAFLRGAGDH